MGAGLPLLLLQAHEEDVVVSLDGGSEDGQLPSPGRAPGGSAGSSHQGGLGGPACYGTALGVVDSDHKPVWCRLAVQLPAYDQERKRWHSEQVRARVRVRVCRARVLVACPAHPPDSEASSAGLQGCAHVGASWGERREAGRGPLVCAARRC